MTAVAVGREQVLRYRAHRQQLDTKLPKADIARAAHGGLQDSVPRGAVISLHARVRDVDPASWEDPALAQIWFRGGTDYVIPRSDIGVFTLGSLPRDASVCADLEEIADAATRVLDGEVLKVREVADRMTLRHPLELRNAARTGRLLIRWNANMIWLIANDRPSIEPEVARLELARRFLTWLGPQTRQRFAWWAAIEPKDARATWDAIASELVTVDVGGEERSMLDRDLDALVGAEPIEGVRLLPADDAFTKTHRDLLVTDDKKRSHAFPPIGTSPGYIPGAILVDGELAGVWQRQQRKVTIHPWRKLPKDEVEAEALSFPISSTSKPSVRWEPS
ncbi:MAG: crosslink repair DNA glycosylase YcaQ family protein [Actinomycetota bacterium]